ncbi:Mannose-6-phosphate isomerase [Meloidogyne graminicola]|uniref:mannose-6-phosphate isomerase n=1 Tax=Meloidogyne graminicola TaxID=189291 RepID=A0A8S9ZYJ3_9BILA|nr:Mannose-6-phosphate isomerase [Meloidogyne graminicola]
MKRLECKIQNYKWGKKGITGIVAQLSKQVIEEDESYAELWMGTHKNGPSKIENEQITLAEYFEKNPNVLGQYEKKGLNFLFKVLSVGTSLSVQSHPTKDQAIYLHSKDPKNYPDDNHKPEMAIAITDFELLCGFRKPEEILLNLLLNKEIIEIIGDKQITQSLMENDEQKCKDALKNIFTKIWFLSEDKIKDVLNKILSRIFLKEERTNIDDLIMRLNDQYPDDIGIIAPLFLNYFTLKPGEATFLGPNEPHAYLYGDCVECMALSDNTIRAGLTPKFKDIKTLCDNLTYKMSDPPIFLPKILSNGIVEYAPPVEEFAVHKLDDKVSILPSIPAASIMIIIRGEAILLLKNDKKEEIKEGNVLFIPQLFEGKIEEKSKDFLAFRAFTPF